MSWAHQALGGADVHLQHFCKEGGALIANVIACEVQLPDGCISCSAPHSSCDSHSPAHIKQKHSIQPQHLLKDIDCLL